MKSSIKKSISIFLAIVTLFSVFATFSITSSAAVMANSFTPRYNIPNKNDTWITAYNTSNNCTRYCYGRISEILNCDATSILGARPGAGSFPTILNKAGYKYGSTPKLGAVMCTSGHVAIVESIDLNNGTILISEGDSYTDVSKDRKTEKSLVDGKSVMGYSTLTRESGKGHGTWFALRRIAINYSAKYYYIVNECPYFNSTALLKNDYNLIQVKFTVNNPTNAKITEFRTQIRKKGQTKWSGFKKTGNTTKSVINKTSTISASGGCKYTIADNTTYEIRGIVISGNKSYYSAITQVTTPARINIGNTTVNTYKTKFTDSNISTNNLIKVYYNGVQLKKGTDYKLSKDSVKSIGKHKITITGIGKYKASRTVTVTIYPKTPTLNSLSYSSVTGRISLKWDRVADCTKQQIAISKSSSFSSSNTALLAVDQSKQSCSIYAFKINGKDNHVQKGKTYYIKMRAYKIVDGERIYGKWGSVKSIKCK